MNSQSANNAQENIIKNSKIPAAVIAGPGTGKTFTISQKVVDLAKNQGIAINKILITTFTKKAAAELNTRIIRELKAWGVETDLKDLKIGNFHNLANTYLSKYRHPARGFFTPFSIDNEQEGYLISKNLAMFEQIPGFITGNPDKEIKFIQDTFQHITNNLIDPNELKNSNIPYQILQYRVYMTHLKLLRTSNMANFQLMLRDFYDLLIDEKIGDEIRSEIDFVIIDEYQDTNFIQQEIAFKLLKNNNILVFGDDDQSLYNFRGADPRNLTEFSKICEDKLNVPAHIYKLDVNYRSTQELIDFSARYINRDFFTDRYHKDLKAHRGYANTNTVIKVDAWDTSKLIKIINELKPYIKLNQIAFLFPSLKPDYCRNLERDLEKAGIAVINHSISRFFERPEIKLMIFILANIYTVYPAYDPNFYAQTSLDIDKEKFENYIRGLYDDDSYKNKEIMDFVAMAKEDNLSMAESFYRALDLSPFKKILSYELGYIVTDRAQKNLATFSQKIAEFDEMFAQNAIYPPAEFLYGYLFYYFRTNKIAEFEELEDSYDAVNFMTIHNSKGLEFEVVFVTTLYENLYKNQNFDIEYGKDFYRKYYTAFTRAESLLVLIDNSSDEHIYDLTKALPTDFDIEKLGLREKKKEIPVPILAYTTDIEVFEACPLKYKFIRELGFREAYSPALDYGSKVHKLAEEINKAKLNGDMIEGLEQFLEANPAFKEPITSFIKRDFKIIDSEVNYKSSRDFYILQGNIDAITIDNSILDIKTGNIDDFRLGKYKKQLITYKLLMELNGERPNDLYLYFINSDRILKASEPAYDLAMVDRIAKSIIDENIYQKTYNFNECKYCPMRYYCERD